MRRFVLILILLTIGIYAGNRGLFSRSERRNNVRSITRSATDHDLIEEGLNENTTDPTIIEVSEKETFKIKEFFERMGSPLSKEAGIFTWVSARYRLPYNLLPAIAMVESSGGKHLIQSSFNPFGWNHGRATFNSYTDSIVYVGKAIAENRVYREFQQQRSIESLGKVYAEDKNWASKVKYWQEKIEGR